MDAHTVHPVFHPQATFDPAPAHRNVERLTPQAYCYLRHPVLSSGEPMLQYTIQHLCFTGALRVEKKRMAAHPRDPRLVTRLLLTRMKDARPTTRAERYALDLFPAGKSISLGQLRARFKKEDTDFERFKWEQMLPDLLEARLLYSRVSRSPLGRSSMEAVRRTRKRVDKEIDKLLEMDKAQLASLLGELGSNIVLLKKETRDKLRGLVKELPELALTLNLGGTMDSALAFDFSAAFDTLSIGDSFDSAGGFDGFGGGDFGGGGDGGDW